MLERFSLVESAGLNRKKKTDEELLDEIKSELLTSKISPIQSGDDDVLDEIRKKVSGLASWYYWLGDLAENVTVGKHEKSFNVIMVSIIFVSGLVVGVQQYYPTTSSKYSKENEVLYGINCFIFAAFALEFLLKIVAEKDKPYKYFIGDAGFWNTFDLLVLIFSFPVALTPKGNLGIAKVTRLSTKIFRLLRVVKLLHSIPTLNVIVNGLFAGAESLMYIVMVLMLVLYIFAVIGCMQFGRSDPFFFGNIFVSVVTLFHALTYDNWGTNLRINMYGCHLFNAGIYSSFDESRNTLSEWEATVPYIYRCSSKDYPQYYLYGAGFYWIVYLTLSALILLSMFVAVTTINMEKALNNVREEAEEAERKNHLRAQMEEIENVTRRHYLAQLVNTVTDEELEALGKVPLLSRIYRLIPQLLASTLNFGDPKAARAMSLNDEQKLERLNEMKQLLQKAWVGSIFEDEHAAARNVLSWRARYLRRVALRARQIINSDYFNFFIVGFLIFTAIVVGVETDVEPNADSSQVQVFVGLESVIFAVFLAEVLLTMASEEFSWREYFASKWNIFDFAITVCTALQLGGTITSNLFPVARLVRVFRVVKLFRALPQLGIIVNAVWIAGNSLSYLLAIIVLVIYLWALVGNTFFAENDPENFGTLHLTMLILLDVLTLDQWGVIMYKNIYGCNLYPRGSSCESPNPQPKLAFVYFALFLIVGSFTLLTLFIGVVATGLEEATKHYTAQVDIDRRLKMICIEKNVESRVLDIYTRVFDILDMDGSGTIEAQEVLIGLNCIGIHPSQEKLFRWIKEVDHDFNGSFDMAEFVMFMVTMYHKHIKTKFKTTVHRVVKSIAKAKSVSMDIRAKEPSMAPATSGKLMSKLNFLKPIIQSGKNNSAQSNAGATLHGEEARDGDSDVGERNVDAQQCSVQENFGRMTTPIGSMGSKVLCEVASFCSTDGVVGSGSNTEHDVGGRDEKKIPSRENIEIGVSSSGDFQSDTQSRVRVGRGCLEDTENISRVSSLRIEVEVEVTIPAHEDEFDKDQRHSTSLQYRRHSGSHHRLLDVAGVELNQHDEEKCGTYEREHEQAADLAFNDLMNASFGSPYRSGGSGGGSGGDSNGSGSPWYSRISSPLTQAAGKEPFPQLSESTPRGSVFEGAELFDLGGDDISCTPARLDVNPDSTRCVLVESIYAGSGEDDSLGAGKAIPRQYESRPAPHMHIASECISEPVREIAQKYVSQYRDFARSNEATPDSPVSSQTTTPELFSSRVKERDWLHRYKPTGKLTSDESNEKMANIKKKFLFSATSSTSKQASILSAESDSELDLWLQKGSNRKKKQRERGSAQTALPSVGIAQEPSSLVM